MSDYKYKDVPLMSDIAKELLVELFDGKTFKRTDAETAVVDTHIERGGLLPREQRSVGGSNLMSRALFDLIDDKIAFPISRLYCRIATDESKVPKYKYEGVPLITEIAAELILELFDGKAISNSKIAERIMEVHVERGGLQGDIRNCKRYTVVRALALLKSDGCAFNPIKSYWRIASDKMNMPDYKYADIPLTNKVARDLLVELFEGKNVATSYAVDIVLETHIKRGGIKSDSLASAIVKGALSRLNKYGIAKNIVTGYWFIESLDATDVDLDDTDELDDWDAEDEDIIESEPIDVDCDNVIGYGSGSVYVYYYPTFKEMAKSNGTSTYPCKVGMSFNQASGRVRSQATALPEKPEIGLVIKTDNPAMLEKAIHSILGMRGKHESDAPGSEWYDTNPTEVEEIFGLIGGQDVSTIKS